MNFVISSPVHGVSGHKRSARAQFHAMKTLFVLRRSLWWQRLLHVKGPTIEGNTVELLDSFISLNIVAHQDIGKSERLPAVAVANDSCLEYAPEAFKQGLHLICLGQQIQISNVNSLHSCFLTAQRGRGLSEQSNLHCNRW